MNALVDHEWGASPAADRVCAQVSGMRLSIAAGRLLMVLQAYMDESFDDDGTIVIAGYISTAARWVDFAKAWERELEVSGVPDKQDRRRFKMSEMAMSPMRMERVSAYHRIIADHALMSVSFTMNERDLTRALERIHVDYITIVWREQLTPYYVAFRLFMENFHNSRTERMTIPGWDWPEFLDGPIDFYFDDRTEKGSILGGWEEYLASRPLGYAEMYGATPRFESDDDFLPLQAADFRAWWVRRWSKEHGPDNAGMGRYFGFVWSEKTMPHLMLSVTEDQLAGTFKEWARQSLAGTEDYFKVRDAKTVVRPDPPAPLEKALASLGRWASNLFGRR